MEFFLGLTCSAILCVTAAFHIYWSLGGSVGVGVSLPLEADGTPVAQPGRLVALGVGLTLLAVMLATLAVFKIIVLPFSSPLIRVFVGCWAVIFLTRALSWHRSIGLFKSIRTTRFAAFDTWLYSPLCLLLAFGLALGASALYP